MNKREEQRNIIGQQLRAFRESKGLTVYRVGLIGGIQQGQAKAVEAGNANYTIDVFLSYLKGCGIKMSFHEESK